MAKNANDAIQEQLIAARRSQILDAAISVFAEKGFARATIKDIAREAGIADGTIYIYFENKTALLLGILHSLDSGGQSPADFPMSDDVNIEEILRFFLRQRLEALAPKGMQVVQIVLSEMLINRDMRDLYRQQVIEPTFTTAAPLFQMWIDKGLLKPFDVPLVLRTITSMVLGLLVLRLMGDPLVEEQWSQLPDVIIDMVLKGIQKP